VCINFLRFCNLPLYPFFIVEFSRWGWVGKALSTT
jgi:hypothetical protein